MYSTQTGIYFTFITGLSVLTILLLIFVISVIRQQKKRLREYKAQVLREINMIESERKRIAADLHDDLGSILAAARLGTESICDASPGNALPLKVLSHMTIPFPG
jgi:signal transduction histidine kinase